MKEKDLISVIVPVYKVEQYLERCVNSITNQTYKNLEIILVDDGSPDGSPALCDKLAKTDKRIKVIHKKNGGVSSARNEGMKHASGDYVAFIDSDDWIEPKMYEEMHDTSIMQNAEMTFCLMNTVEPNMTVHKLNEFNISKIADKDIKYFFVNAQSGDDFAGVTCGPCRTLYKKEIIDGLKYNESLKYGEDVYFLLDAMNKSNKISVCQGYFYNYFTNTSSVCHNINQSYFDNVKKFHEFSLKYFNENKLDFDYLLDNLYIYRNTMNRIQNKDFVKQMKELYKSDELFRNCFKKQTLKKIQKFELGLKQKIRNFLMYHRCWRLMKILSNKK